MVISMKPGGVRLHQQTMTFQGWKKNRDMSSKSTRRYLPVVVCHLHQRYPTMSLSTESARQARVKERRVLPLFNLITRVGLGVTSDMKTKTSGFLFYSRYLRLFLFLQMLVSWSTSSSETLDLADLPLHLGQSVTPNVFWLVDDSLSMDNEFATVDYYPYCSYDAATPTKEGSDKCGNLEVDHKWTTINPDGRIRQTLYGFNNDDNVRTGNHDCHLVLETCPAPYRYLDWRAYSHDMNLLYYDPSNTYAPWINYSDASFNSAHSHPVENDAGFGLVRDLAGFVYHEWIDNKGYDGSRPKRGVNDNHNLMPNGEVDVWDDHIRYTVNNDSITYEKITVQNPGANCDTDCGLVFLVSDSGTISGAATDSFGRTVSQIKQNVANWYQYHRRREFVAKNAMATIFDESNLYRYGLSVFNDFDNVFTEVPSSSLSKEEIILHNEALIKKTLSHRFNLLGTPTRGALDKVGKYFKGEGYASPISHACQKNFVITVTDGLWTNHDNFSIADVDGDGRSSMFSDVARYYYENDLSSLDDQVPTDDFDTAKYQHLNLINVGIGVEGVLKDIDGDGWPDTDINNGTENWISESGNWGDDRIDDLWHAAYNSRGLYLAAQKPNELIDVLKQALGKVSQQLGGSSSVSLNSGSIANESLLFQASFHSSDWSGRLDALVFKDGVIEVDAPAWRAHEKLNAKSDEWARSSRKVFTYSGGSGSQFSWNGSPGLSTGQKQILDINPVTGLSDGLAEERVEFIRGVLEFTDNAVTFRNRSHRLGDIVHSSPAYVQSPDFVYDFDNYADFIKQQKNRQAMVYAGANDGMLHAFNAETGEEKFAYVPEALMHKLPELTNSNYSHRFYVDGPVSIGDVQINGQWRTYLVGTLRAGGQGLYVLDVTDPSSMTSSNVVLEMSDGRGSKSLYADEDLGYTFSEAQIRKMNNGKWAAIIGNGYNATQDDGFSSSDGRASLFIVYLDGSGYVKIPVPAGSVNNPNGLSTPSAVDLDGDFETDIIYAGDLYGNLWRFDVSGNNWHSASSNVTSKLYAPLDTDQPITVRPEVTYHPNGETEGLLVYFGTGKYIEKTDKTHDIPVQSLYAVWDKMDGSTSSSVLRRELTTSSPRKLSNYDVPDWDLYDVIKIDLAIAGERATNNPVIRNNAIYFNTVLPEDSVCGAGGTGWSIVLDTATVSAVTRPLVDRNSDGKIDENDLDLDGDGEIDQDLPVTLSEDLEGIPTAPVFLMDDKGGSTGQDPLGQEPPTPTSMRSCGPAGPLDIMFTADSKAEIDMETLAADKSLCGRIKWIQLR